MMQLKSFFCFILVLLMFFGVAVGSGVAEPVEEPYRIGVIIPLSGQVASLGHYVRRGIDLAIEDLPASQRGKIKVLYEDDQFEAKKTVTAYRKLSGKAGVDAVFVIGSPPANALGPITEKDKRILIAIGASDPTIAIGKEYSFTHWVIPPVLGRALVNELKRRDFKRIAFLSAEVSGALADMQATLKEAETAGISDRIVYKETFPRAETDYRATIAKLRTKKVDAVIVVFFAGALSSFAKQMEAAQLPAELIGMETFEDESEVKASEGSLIGKWYVNASDAADWFVKRYKEHYGEHPGWATANGYDALRLVVKAVLRVGKDNLRVRDFLRSIKDYEGAGGTYSASGDNRFNLPAALKVVTKSGFERLNRSEEK